MAHASKSKVLSICGVVTLVVLAGACGGGSNRAGTSVTPTSADSSSPASPADSPSTSAKAKRSKQAAAKAKAKAKSKTSTTTKKTSGSSPGTQNSPSGAGAAPTGSASVAPSGNSNGNGAGSSGPPTTAYRPKPYDPSKPIDLGGFPGVSPAQQARAEKLVRDSLKYLPKYASPNAAYADGYRTIGDEGTGDEHYVKWSYIDDGRVLDPKYPESLVYEMINGKKTLVAAMYIMPFNTRYTDIPDVGGPMTQWHVHNDLCLLPTSDPLQKVVRVGLPDGTCPPGQTTAGKAPMLHVWIVANKCGPFAALEGIGAGQTTDGNGRLCDRVHGSP